MRAVVQRVAHASVTVDEEVVGRIERGLLVLLAVHNDDSLEECRWMVEKVANLRIFTDESEKMNLSVGDVEGGVLVVSQFTLYGNCLRGRRPDFLESAPPEIAEPLYERFISQMQERIDSVERGRFGARMEVKLLNDGPVTMLIDSPIKNGV